MTKSTQSDIRYLIDQQHIVLALEGELRFLDSARLEEAFSLVQEQWAKQKQCLKVLIDLTKAILIDSTVYGLIASYAVKHKKLAGSQVVIYYNSDDIHRELLHLQIDKLCVLDSATPPFDSQESKFITIEKHRIIKKQIENNIRKSHKALADLTDNPAIQAVVDTISNPNKGH